MTATNGNGYVTDYYNDGNGDITKKVVHTAGCHSGAPSTYETDYTYSTDGQYNKLTEVDPDGNRTSWTYDANANVTSETKSFASGATVNSSEGTQSLTATTYYTYEPRFNQVASVQDPNGNVTTYNYGTADTNPGGNLLSVTYPSTAAGTATESYTYNSLGQVLTDTAPDGTVTQNTYDDSTGYLTQTVKDYGTGKLNATTHFAYDEYGHVDQTTDPDGHTTTITTDAQDNVTEIDGASGEVEQKSYDVNGNLTTDQKQAPGGLWQRTDSVYNNDEQLVATRQYTDASDYLETDYTYDADGNRASVTDPLHHTTSTAYDERDMPYKTTDQLGNTTTLDFDGEGNTIRLTDELGHVTTYAFDGLNRLEQKTFPDGSYQTWTYDATGNITSLRTTGGHTVTQTFDARNRMLTQSYTAATGSSTITNVYDIMGRLSTTTEGGTSLSYSYDNLGRNTSFTDQAGLTSTYSYDLAGNRTSTTYPTSVTVQRAHDASNRVTTLEDGSNNVQATYSYDSLDRPTGMTLANSTSVAWNYDLLGRMTSVGNTLQTGNRNYSYGYDNASRRTSVTEPRGTVSFGYTNRNEVNAVTEPSGSPFADQSFTYDAGFNRSNWTSGTTSTGYTVNNLNQYTAVASATPSWNGDGGLASFNGNTYTYDGMMRLVEVDNSLGKYLFSYDPTGRRVKKVLESTSGTVLETFSYHYDGSEVAVEYTPTNTWTYYLGLGIDQPVMRVNGSTKQWYYADAQGSISAVADNSGNALEQYEYDPQGHVEVTNGSGTAETGTMIDNYIAFTGRNFDFETGNYFYRARYYSPDLGRFISRDPLSGAEFSQGTNLYAYCGNDPVNYSDPTGMDKKKQKELYDAAKKHFEDEGWPSWLAAEMASAGMWANDHHDALEDANAALMAAQMLDGAGELEALGEEGAEAADGAAAGLCFKEGTLVATPNGEKPIEAIKAGEEVYAYDFNRGKVVASHVREVYRNTTDQWEDLTLADGEAIHCTPKHRFWVESEHAWLEAFRLRHGMALLAETGLVETVKQISVRQLPAPEKTYNFNVEGEHDYFVGKAKILVHNSCSAPSSSDLTEGARSALGKGPDATPGQPLTDTQSAGLQKNLDAAVNSASKALQNPDAEASASRYNTSADRIQQISNTVSSGVGAARN